MKVVTGDLIKMAKDGEFNLIVHGCNCMCTMGKGIALQIKKNFPEAYEADQRSVKGLKSKLGDTSSVWIDDYNLMVVNGYTQYDFRPTYDDDGVVRVDYEAIKKVFRTIGHNCRGLKNFKIGYPKIGAGLAGGDWDIISKIIDKELDGLDHTLVEWDG